MRRMDLQIMIFLIMIFFLHAASQGQISPWPRFRQNKQNTGLSPYTGPVTPTLQWTYQTNDAVASSAAIGPDGTIYVGSGYTPDATDSALYAINPDGTLKWKFKTGSGVFSSPAIGPDSAIHFGSWDRSYYVLEDSVTYAKLRVKNELSWAVMSSPLVLDNGDAYMGCLNFRLYAFNPAGDIKWEIITGWCVFSSPAITDDNIIYVGSKDHNLYSITDNGDDYTIHWEHPFGEFFDGHLADASPAVGEDGTIYIGTDPYGAANQTPVPIDTSFFAVNPDGSRKWAFATNDGVETSPGIGPDGTIYFGSYDSTVYAVTDGGSEGILKWSYKTGGVVDASPTIGADGTIYIGSRDSTLYAFNPDGSIRWIYEAGGGIESSVTIAGNGTIYFGCFDGKVYALGNPEPDVGAVLIDMPSEISAGETIQPVVIVRNYRTTPQTFEVFINIEQGGETVHSDQIMVSDNDGGKEFRAFFSPWIPDPDLGLQYDITTYTVLVSDNNLINDSAFYQVLSVEGEPGVCGDPNGDGNVNILDIVFLIEYKYKSGPAPYPFNTSDVNSDGNINILDIVYLLDFKYKDGSDPFCL
ncbi:MAG: hypothetical protein DRP51_00170 [Candidatus Zixiibacteriota bacterium]|nr:MAG: hypothetical protein DRP51_00170 [candidate division Zixibacteria bacterium]HHI03804.1 hypothetical protein [candidate division Zixibacteria bacterium]